MEFRILGSLEVLGAADQSRSAARSAEGCSPTCRPARTDDSGRADRRRALAGAPGNRCRNGANVRLPATQAVRRESVDVPRHSPGRIVLHVASDAARLGCVRAGTPLANSAADTRPRNSDILIARSRSGGERRSRSSNGHRRSRSALASSANVSTRSSNASRSGSRSGSTRRCSARSSR